MIPFAHHDCEWVSRDKMELPFEWDSVCLLGTAQTGKRRFSLPQIMEVLMSADTTFIVAEGRGDRPSVLTYHAYGPKRDNPIHVLFGFHRRFPVGKIMHACRDLCDNSRLFLRLRYARLRSGHEGE